MRVMNIAVLAVAAVVLPLAAPVQASDGTEITTPYPAVAVEPGETVTFALTVTAPTPRRVDLAVSQLPDGWTATLRGGGLVIDSVMTDPETAPEVQLDVDVPPDASQGVYAAEVVATTAGVAHPLPLQLRVAEAVGGDVALTAEFPSLQGAADATFSFDLELANNTAEEQTFNLEAAGPEGWQVTATPSQEERAATATVPAGNTATIQVEADPPDTVTAGTYPIAVRASGGGQSAEAELEVVITGSYAMTLTTPDERLNAEATAGGSTDVALAIVNDGSAPLVAVELTADPPADWEVTFEPAIVEQIPPGETAMVSARIVPSGEAVAGDYIVGVSAATPEVSGNVDLRVTVETSAAWGLVGVLLILAALGGLAWVFRRYGRR